MSRPDRHPVLGLGCDTKAIKSSRLSIWLIIWLVAVAQLIYSSIREPETRTTTTTTTGPSNQIVSDDYLGPATMGPVMFANAGKKKKKEKSEVVVISVQNSPAKGHGMYPVFIPSCGGGHGYGRRKRSVDFKPSRK